jgi:fructokinase
MRIGIDLGGTKIEGIALDPTGDILFRDRRNSPAGSYDAILDAIAGLVSDIETKAGRRGTIGIGIPGAVSSATGLVKNANTTCLIGRPFGGDIAEKLGREVRVANDADCFALSEATDGAAAGARSVFGVILGTGVGGGLVIDGKLLSGPNGIAGEWGHNPLPWPRDEERPGPPCYCGKSGCIETFLSGPGMSGDHRSRFGETLDAATIARRANAGDGHANETLERYADRLARALASVINVVDPEVVVLGGGLSNIPMLYGKLPELLPRYVFSDRMETEIRPPLFGDSSGVRGAAWLWPKDTTD